MSKLCLVSEFANLPSRVRLSHILPLLTACSHDDLLAIQSAITQLFFRDFIQHLPSDLSLLILTKLTLRDILSCMLVSTAWYNVIQHCSLLWKHQSQLLVPLQSIHLSDSQWKTLCRNAKLFQIGLYEATTYRVDKFDTNREEMRILQLFSCTDYLLIHGLVGDSLSLYKDVLLVWKWEEENEFYLKMDILDTVDIGGYQFPFERKTGSRISRILLSSNFLFVLHLYLEVFDMRTLSFFSRIKLPSMSEVMGLDFTENSDNSLNLIAVAFFDCSVHVIEPSSGAIIHRLEIEDRYLKIFSLFCKPSQSILIHSELGTSLFDISNQSHKINILGESLDNKDVSLKVSKDRESIAFLRQTDSTIQQTFELIVFTTSTWRPVYHNEMSSCYGFYAILDIGRRYVVLLNTIAKLELLIYDIQVAQPPKCIVFYNIRACRDIFSTDNIITLSSSGWVDGKVYDKFGEEGKTIPLFLVLTKSTPSPLNILSLAV